MRIQYGISSIMIIVLLLCIVIITSTYTKPSKTSVNKNSEFINDKIYLSHSPIGSRGVFAKEDIQKGEIIEVCPIILEAEDKIIKNSNIMQYVFYSDASESEYAIAFGYGSMYNHNDKNNAEWKVDKPNLKLIITAIKDIQKGDEIYVSYGSKYWTSRGSKPL